MLGLVSHVAIAALTASRLPAPSCAEPGSRSHRDTPWDHLIVASPWGVFFLGTLCLTLLGWSHSQQQRLYGNRWGVRAFAAIAAFASANHILHGM